MEAIRNILETAINKFNENDLYLIENDLSERCICGRLACYIQQALMTSQFSEYTVDVEYNRGAKGKDKSPKFLHDKLIVVDLIVHKMGHTEYGFDNLFCVEMKKSNSRYGYNSDKARLKDMTNYDLVFGGVANDKVFNTVELFFDGLIDKAEAINRLRYERPNPQICFCTEKALSLLHFEGSERL